MGLPFSRKNQYLLRCQLPSCYQPKSHFRMNLFEFLTRRKTHGIPRLDYLLYWLINFSRAGERPTLNKERIHLFPAGPREATFWMAPLSVNWTHNTTRLADTNWLFRRVRNDLLSFSSPTGLLLYNLLLTQYFSFYLTLSCLTLEVPRRIWMRRKGIELT